MPKHSSRFRVVALALFALAFTAEGSLLRAEDLTKTRPCGPDWIKGPLRYLLPQGFFGANFCPACTRHDNCYADPDSDQKTCDIVMLNEMRCACEQSRFPRLCRVAAKRNYILVRIFGRFSR